MEDGVGVGEDDEDVPDGCASGKEASDAAPGLGKNSEICLKLTDSRALQTVSGRPP